MFVVTNRKIDTSKEGIEQFGKSPNEKGPNEIRIFEAKRRRNKWHIDVLPDKLTKEQKASVDIPSNKTAYASQYVAKQLLDRIRKKKKNLLFFVHGYNNDIEAVLERAENLEKQYGVEVLAFSWPANGGGVKGVTSYKSDKRDAIASAGAVYRTMEKMRTYLDALNQQRLDDIRSKLAEKYPDNLELRQTHFCRMAEMGCPFKISLLLHSMGNYLFKKIQCSSTYDGHHMLFDNVILAAADTNNEQHSEWVDRIACRRRVYITINEDDSALRFSRIKSGEEQRARLGHYLHRLDSTQALYVNVTEAKNVGSSHAYFEGDATKDKRSKLYRFFKAAINGDRAEKYLSYDTPSNTWQP